MKRSLLTNLLATFFLALSFSSAVNAEKLLRLLVSAGALVDQRSAFYDSRVFKGEDNPPFEIIGMTTALVSDTTIIYSPAGALSEEEIKAAVISESKGVGFGFVGPSFRGFSLSGNNSQEVTEYLGAESIKFFYEVRKSANKTIYAFAKAPGHQPIWPKNNSLLKEVPCAHLRERSGQEQIVTARSVGSFASRLGLIDHLRKKHDKNTALIELGANLGESAHINKEKVDALAARKPAAVFLGTVEMASLLENSGSLSTLTSIYPFADRFHDSRTLADTKLGFWSAAFNEKLWPLYLKLGSLNYLGDQVLKMKAQASSKEKPLNIVRVFSEDAAIEAAKSVYVDLVLLVAKDPYAPLAASETIEQSDKSSYVRVAPIVRVSYLDVAEVLLYGSSKVDRVEIIRHPITDQALDAHDIEAALGAVSKPALPDLGRPWQAADFDRVLGGMMIGASGADIAVFERVSVTSNIAGGIPFDLAKHVLSPDGNLATILVSGKQVKKILKNLKTSKQLVTYGVDHKTNKIGGRAINDNEKYTLALSEKALLDISGLAMVGGLNDEFAVRAPFVEAIYGDMKSIYFIGGPKSIIVGDTALEIEDAVRNNIRAGRPFYELADRFLMTETSDAIKRMLDEPYGHPHHVITLDIAYLDIGLSKNVMNDTYDTYRAEKVLPMGRSKVTRWAHLFLYAKTALNYDAPYLQTSLTGEIKYLHTNLYEEPEKDKTKVGLKFKLPWERSVFKDKAVVMAPLLKSIYETKLTPHFFSEFKPKAARTQRIDTLLGFNVDFTKLGFNFDIGGVMAADFNRANPANALDFGPGLNFFSKWTLFGPVELSTDITSYYLFPLPSNTAIDKIAFAVEGTVWLRLLRFYDFSVSAMSDFLIATLQRSPKDFALSSIFGLTISYGRLFRLLG